MTGTCGKSEVELLHGNLVMQYLSQRPPTDKHELVQQAFLAGRLTGVGESLRVYDRGVSDPPRPELAETYRDISRAYIEAERVAEDGQTTESGNGFL